MLLKVIATPLRYLQMLSDEQIRIKKDDYTCSVPSPWVFAYHKILIAISRKLKDKRSKDILQANTILREVFKNPYTIRKALSYLETLPARWKKYIKDHLRGSDFYPFKPQNKQV